MRRYYCDEGAMVGDTNGGWILYRDHTAELAAKDARIAELEGLVEEAYHEGWFDHRDSEELPGACWEYSDARAALGGEDE